MATSYDAPVGPQPPAPPPRRPTPIPGTWVALLTSWVALCGTHDAVADDPVSVVPLRAQLQPDGALADIAADRAGARVITIFPGAPLAVWRTDTGRTEATLTDPHFGGKPVQAQLSADGTWAAARSSTGDVAAWRGEGAAALSGRPWHQPDGVPELRDTVDPLSAAAWTAPPDPRVAEAASLDLGGPRGRTLIVGLDDGRVWQTRLEGDASTLTRVWIQKAVRAVAAAPDDAHFAAVNDDGDVCIRPLTQGSWSACWRLRGTTAAGWMDPRHLLLAQGDRLLMVAEDGGEPTELAQLPAAIQRMQVQPGARVLLQLESGAVWTAPWTSPEAIRPSKTAVADAERPFVAGPATQGWTQGPDGRLLARDIDTGEASPPFPSGLVGVRALTWAGSGTRLVVLLRDGGVRVWDLERGGHAAPHLAPSATDRAVAASREGGTLALANADGTVRVVDGATGAVQRTFTAPEERTHGTPVVALSPDGTQILVCRRAGRGTVFAVDTGAVRQEFRWGPNRLARRPEVCRLALSDDGDIAAYGIGHALVTVDVQTGEPLTRHRVRRGGPSREWRPLISPDGAVVGLSRPGETHLWDRSTGAPLPPPGVGLDSVDAHQQLSWDDGWLTLHRGGNRHPIAPTHTLVAAAPAPTGPWLAVAQSSGEMALWDLAGPGPPTERLRLGHGSDGEFVAWDPQGRFDGTLGTQISRIHGAEPSLTGRRPPGHHQPDLIRLTLSGAELPPPPPSLPDDPAAASATPRAAQPTFLDRGAGRDAVGLTAAVRAALLKADDAGVLNYTDGPIRDGLWWVSGAYEVAAGRLLLDLRVGRGESEHARVATEAEDVEALAGLVFDALQVAIGADPALPTAGPGPPNANPPD